MWAALRLGRGCGPLQPADLLEKEPLLLRKGGRRAAARPAAAARRPPAAAARRPRGRGAAAAAAAAAPMAACVASEGVSSASRLARKGPRKASSRSLLRWSVERTAPPFLGLATKILKTWKASYLRGLAREGQRRA